MKKFLLLVSLLAVGYNPASALTNQSLIYFQSDFRNSTAAMPLGDWTCAGSGKTSQNVKVGQSDLNLRRFFPVGAQAYVPVEIDDIGMIYCSNSTTEEGGYVEEWLISPAIDMSHAPENAILSFDAVAFGSINQPKYEIYYSTTGNKVEDFVNKLYTGKQNNSEILPISTHKYVSLKGIDAETVYFAFVNKSRNAQILGFQNICVAEYDLNLTNSTPVFVVDEGDYPVQLTVELTTPVACEGFSVELSSDIWTEPQVYTTSKQVGSSYTSTIIDFEKPISLKSDQSVAYTVTIQPNYEGATPSMFNFDISCTKGYPAVCVEEEATGTWCGYCVRGIAGLKQFSDEFGDRFIGIAVHGNNDPMRVDSYINPLSEQSRLTGFPSAWFNRSYLSDPYSRELVQSIIDNKVAHAVEIKAVNFDENSGRVMINYDAKISYNTSSAQINAVAIVTEDGVTGKTPMWNQSNYYSGSGRQSIVNLYGEAAWKYFEEFCEGSSSIPFTEIKYDHVAQGIFNSYYGGGENGSLPSTWEAGKSQNFTISFDMPYQTSANGAGVQNWKNTHMIVLLLDAVSGKVLNADKFGADKYTTDPAAITAVDGSVCPIVEAFGGTVKVTAPAGSSVSVVNALGYRMHSTVVGSEGSVVIDGRNFSGVMMVQVATGNSVYVKKLIF